MPKQRPQIFGPQSYKKNHGFAESSKFRVLLTIAFTN